MLTTEPFFTNLLTLNLLRHRISRSARQHFGYRQSSISGHQRQYLPHPLLWHPLKEGERRCNIELSKKRCGLWRIHRAVYIRKLPNLSLLFFITLLSISL
jgi:hypothetical protein